MSQQKLQSSPVLLFKEFIRIVTENPDSPQLEEIQNTLKWDYALHIELGPEILLVDQEGYICDEQSMVSRI